MKWILLLASATLVAGCAAAAKPQGPGVQADTTVPAVSTAPAAPTAAAPAMTAATATAIPTSSPVQLRAVLAGPDDEGRLRGKVVNESRDYVAGVALTLTVDGERLAEPAGGDQILGRLTGGSRMLKAYERNATRVQLVPLDEGSLPLPGPEGNGWALSFGADADHLMQLGDLPPGGELVATYNSSLPEDWRATRNAIDSDTIR